VLAVGAYLTAVIHDYGRMLKMFVWVVTVSVRPHDLAKIERPGGNAAWVPKCGMHIFVGARGIGYDFFCIFQLKMACSGCTKNRALFFKVNVPATKGPRIYSVGEIGEN